MKRKRVAAVLVVVLVTANRPQAQDATEATLVERGEEAYVGKCSYCHDRLPEESALDMLPGVASLTLKYNGELSPYIRERPELANADVLTAFLRNGAGSMQPFRKTEVTDEDIAAIAAYFRETSEED